MGKSQRMPAVFFGHGSPMIALETNATSKSWATIAAAMPKPKAILAISAHWETRVTAVTAMARPTTIHDFGASIRSGWSVTEKPSAYRGLPIACSRRAMRSA